MAHSEPNERPADIYATLVLSNRWGSYTALLETSKEVIPPQKKKKKKEVILSDKLT